MLPRPNGNCILPVGAVVAMVKVTDVALVVRLPELPLNRQVACAGAGLPEQVYVTGRAVELLDPLVLTNGGWLLLLRAMLIGPVVCPWATVAVPPERFVCRLKLIVVAETTRLTVVLARAPPVDDPVTVTELVPAAMLPGV